MTNRRPPSPRSIESRLDNQITRAASEIRSRFTRGDGRFDLPVVAGRTRKQVARRLA
jgi:hypothetical protein